MTTGIESSSTDRRSGAAMHGGYTTHVNPPAIIADRWWAMVIRGIAAILFGVFAVIAPRTTALALVYIFGVYAIVDGIVHWMSAGRGTATAKDEGRGWIIFQGLVSVAIGVFVLAYPRLSGEMMIMLIAAWAVLTGLAEMVAAFALRRQLQGEWLLATAGLVSIAIGVVLFIAPNMGIVALLWTIGIYAMVFGALMIALGFRLRSWRHGTSRGGNPTPSGAVPA